MPSRSSEKRGYSNSVNDRIREAIDSAERGEAGSLLAATQNCNAPVPIAVVSIFCDGEHFVRNYAEFVETNEVSGVFHINYRQFQAVHGCLARKAPQREILKIAEKFSTMPKKTSRTNGDVTIHRRRTSPRGESPRFAAGYTYRWEHEGDEIFFPVGKDGREGLAKAKQIKKDIDRGMSKRELLERYHPKSRLLARLKAKENKNGFAPKQLVVPAGVSRNHNPVMKALGKSIEGYLKTKEEGRSVHTFRQNKDVLKRFRKFSGSDAVLSTLDSNQIRAYLDCIPPGSRRAHRTILGGFFQWATDEDWIFKNPCKSIKLPRKQHKEVTLFSVDEVEKLMKAASELYDGDFLAYAVLTVFCAIRPDSEIHWLRWTDINFEDEEVVVKKGKKQTPRTIKMHENVIQWLKRCDQNKPIYPESFRSRFAKIKFAVGYKSGTAKTRAAKELEKGHKAWVKDITRHTAISHFLRQSGDKSKTATWAGNSVGVIESHYLGRVTGSETERFWAIRPS